MVDCKLTRETFKSKSEKERKEGSLLSSGRRRQKHLRERTRERGAGFTFDWQDLER